MLQSDSSAITTTCTIGDLTRMAYQTTYVEEKGVVMWFLYHVDPTATPRVDPHRPSRLLNAALRLVDAGRAATMTDAVRQSEAAEQQDKTWSY